MEVYFQQNYGAIFIKDDLCFEFSLREDGLMWLKNKNSLFIKRFHSRQVNPKEPLYNEIMEKFNEIRKTLEEFAQPSEKSGVTET